MDASARLEARNLVEVPCRLRTMRLEAMKGGLLVYDNHKHHCKYLFTACALQDRFTVSVDRSSAYGHTFKSQVYTSHYNRLPILARSPAMIIIIATHRWVNCGT
jgi:hypothetical protein